MTEAEPPQTGSGADSGKISAAGGRDINDSGNTNRNNNNTNRNKFGNKGKNYSHVSNHQKDWQGDTKEIGVVLGLKTEKLTHQTTVDGLLEQLEGYIKKEFDHYEDVLMLVTKEKDPVPILNKEKDNLFTNDEKKAIKDGDQIEQMLMKDKITRYGNRRDALKKNIGKIYELIWSQCTVSIKTMVKGENEYSEKKKNNDANVFSV